MTTPIRFATAAHSNHVFNSASPINYDTYLEQIPNKSSSSPHHKNQSYNTLSSSISSSTSNSNTDNNNSNNTTKLVHQIRQIKQNLQQQQQQQNDPTQNSNQQFYNPTTNWTTFSQNFHQNQSTNSMNNHSNNHSHSKTHNSLSDTHSTLTNQSSSTNSSLLNQSPNQEFGANSGGSNSNSFSNTNYLTNSYLTNKYFLLNNSKQNFDFKLNNNTTHSLDNINLESLIDTKKAPTASSNLLKQKNIVPVINNYEFNSHAFKLNQSSNNNKKPSSGSGEKKNMVKAEHNLVLFSSNATNLSGGLNGNQQNGKGPAANLMATNPISLKNIVYTDNVSRQSSIRSLITSTKGIHFCTLLLFSFYY